MKRYSLYVVVLVLLVITLALASLFTLFSVHYEREVLVEGKVETITNFAQTIDELLYSPLVVYQVGMYPGMREVFVGEVADFEDVVYVRVVSEDGEILQSSIREEAGSTVDKPQLREAVEAEEVLVRDEFFEGEDIKSVFYPGYGDQVIWIGFSLDTVDEMAGIMMQRNLFFSLGMALLIALSIFLVLRTSIVNPLKRMIEACRKARKGTLDTKFDVKSRTEIGVLADTLNNMIEELNSSQKELEEAKGVLEVKVGAKTRELRELNENLESEIEKRTKELQDKLKKLEKFQKLTTGRELRMKELKKEKEKLEKEKEELLERIKKLENEDNENNE